MNPLMEDLLYLLDIPQSEAKAQAIEDSKEAARAAEQRLTLDEFDNLWSAIVGIVRSDEVETFALGFRLGVQLTLEGLKPIYPK